MGAGEILREARRAVGLSQRDLALKAGLPQSTIARIESGGADPRVGTLERLLIACGFGLEAAPRPGAGVDRTLLRERLTRTPKQRIEDAAAADRALARIRGRARRTG